MWGKYIDHGLPCNKVLYFLDEVSLDIFFFLKKKLSNTLQKILN